MNDHPEIINAMHILLHQSNDYVWVKFKKCCGYQIMFPFVGHNSIQALYQHIDLLWKYTTVNLIWIEHGNKNNNRKEKLVVSRGDNRTISQFFLDNGVYRDINECCYTVYFEVADNHEYILNNSHSHKNIN